MVSTIIDAGDKLVNKTNVEPEPHASSSLQGPTGMNRMNKSLHTAR